jgi:ribonucleoside-diphosphate reductase alpha chain
MNVLSHILLIYIPRRVLSGEFIIVNKHLLNDLVELGLWNEDMKHELMGANGSIQNIDEFLMILKSSTKLYGR